MVGSIKTIVRWLIRWFRGNKKTTRYMDYPTKDPDPISRDSSVPLDKICYGLPGRRYRQESIS